MKKSIVIGLIGILCIALLLIIACVRPIIPGSYVEILYPAPDAVVPTEFSIMAVASKWSLGIETYPLLFLGAPESRVALPPCLLELSLDDAPYARSEGGSHHVFRVLADTDEKRAGLLVLMAGVAPNVDPASFTLNEKIVNITAVVKIEIEEMTGKKYRV
jgi:hypothetical protein